MQIERLKYLTDRLKSDTLSPNEKRELYHFYDSFENNSGYTDLIPTDNKAIYRELLYADILQKRKHTRVLYWATGSAAAILIFFLLNLLLFTKKHDQLDKLSQTYYEPKEIASLITPTGEKILLTEEEFYRNDSRKSFKISKNKNGYYHIYLDSALSDHKLPQHIQLKVENGNTYPLALSDGTQVLLQGGSSISIHTTGKNSTERKVYLEGQALFDVAKIKNSSFIIETPHQEIHVLGTKFELAAYREQSYEKLTLYSGKVQLYNSITRHSEILTPNTVSILNKNAQSYKTYVLEHIESQNQMGNWNFEEETLNDIVIKLQKLYSVHIAIDDSISQNTFTGVIPQNMSLKNILDALQKTEQINYYQKDDTIHITSNN